MPLSLTMPPPAVYEQEFRYWPWGRLLRCAADWIKANAPANSFLLEYMCGTGFLVNQVSSVRPDLTVLGVSLNRSYIAYAKHKYPKISVQFQDAMKYHPKLRPDMIVSTAGLHHLARHQQPLFVKKVASELRKGTYFLLGEELIGNYVTEKDRQFAVLEMCSALLAKVVQADAPRDVLAAAIDVLRNDMLESGEYKVCQSDVLRFVKPWFVVEHIHKTWPDTSGAFGDFLFICRRQ
jgi:hypothetical protein